MNKSYCKAAFNHLYTDTASRYRLCCYAQPFNPRISAEEVLPFDYFFSPRMETVRNDMLEGKLIPECSHCYDLEAKNIDSPREWRFNNGTSFRENPHGGNSVKNINNNWLTEVAEHSVELKLRIFGNQCNLSCYMCVPRNSSERAKEMEAIGRHEVFGFKDIIYSEITVSNDRYDEMVEHLIKHHKYIRGITILGGEPFVMPRVKDFLTRLPNPDGKIGIIFNTNLAQIAWLPEFYNKFPSLALVISCDHYGDKLAWIRWPIKVQKFEDNLIRAKELSTYIAISCTISRLNAPDMREISEYYYNKFGIRVDFNPVFEPPALSARQLTFDQKADIIGSLKRWKQEVDSNSGWWSHSVESIIKIMSLPGDPSLDASFYDYIDKLDKHRGTNARSLFGNFI